MKRIKRKIKELMSRPTKNLKKIKNTIVDFTENSLHRNIALPQSSRKPNFSLEEEAAQLAYRRGWDIPVSYFSSSNNSLETDMEEDIIPEPSEDKEIIVRERDPLIERLEKRVGMTEKEGWEALYS